MDYSMDKQSDVKRLKLAFNSVSIYRQCINDPVLQKLYSFIEYLDSSSIDIYSAIGKYNDFFYSLSGKSLSLKEYVIDSILFDENAFSSGPSCSSTYPAFEAVCRASANDLCNLQLIANTSSIMVKKYLSSIPFLSPLELNAVNCLPTWDFEPLSYPEGTSCISSIEHIKSMLLSSPSWALCVDSLIHFHQKHGFGIFARFAAVIWEHSGPYGYLRGIDSPDPVKLIDLTGYDEERSEVINNTRKFLEGISSNNVLLYGDRGTGKSSTVKAILNEYNSRGLRMIEVPKKFLTDFPEIMRKLKNKNQKYIIFVDDLAFEDNEESYTALKAVLEGGLEYRPQNVLIYATSNRRHLIKEKFTDRSGLTTGNPEDEIRASDTIQEKLSLADRFGITVVFSSPDKHRYLQIVDALALKKGLNIEKATLHREALKWELWYNGRSPRTAHQFIDWLHGQITLGLL